MEKTIKLSVEDNKVILPEGVCSALKSLFSGCRVNFLLGAGFSADLLGMLSNNEIVFEALRHYTPISEEQKSKITILRAFWYWSFFSRCIAPIAERVFMYDRSFDTYKSFGSILYRIFSERGNPVLDRQFNIFTTNYDPIIEMIFDNSNCICNDGFEGRIYPRFSTDNYSKSYYRHAVFSNRKAEIPSLNLYKIHGSVTWRTDFIFGGIEYQDYFTTIRNFKSSYESLFDIKTMEVIDAHFTAKSSTEAGEQIEELIGTTIFDDLIANVDKYEKIISFYTNTFLIVNPTKEKFSDTLLNKNYYELLRIFSNELEKENTLLIVNGFSFRDEHIVDLVKRSMVNPSLKLLIFCYKESTVCDYLKRLGDPKNNNITYIYLDGVNLSLEYFNQILSCIHT